MICEYIIILAIILVGFLIRNELRILNNNMTFFRKSELYKSEDMKKIIDRLEKSNI